VLTISKRIYVASSWRNTQQPAVVTALRTAGHRVYDFRNPAPGKHGFSWSELDPNWTTWTRQEYIENVHKPRATEAFNFDQEALHWCDVCVLVLPCGNDAHLEAGYAAGQGKRTIFLLDESFTPGIMYRLGGEFATNIPELIASLED